MQETNLFTEIFPINTEVLPELTAYKLVTIGSNNVDRIGRKLNYQMKDKFGGHWNWDKPAQCLLTDTSQDKGMIDALLKELWEGQDTIYKESLESIERIRCDASTKGIADFVSQALLDDVVPAIKKSLLQHRREKTKYFINLVCFRYGWVVDGHPAVSASIQSELECKDDLKKHAATIQNVNDLIGLHVLDKTKPFEDSMEITMIVGKLGEGDRRKRLLGYKLTSQMRQMIESAPDDELVVKTNGTYDYISSALKIKILNANYAHFGISERLQIATKQRAEYIKPIAEIIKKTGFVGTTYASTNSKNLFMQKEDINYTPELLIGNNQKVSPTGLFSAMKQSGLYKPANNKHIRMALLSTKPGTSLEKLGKSLRKELGELGYTISIGANKTIHTPSRAPLEKAIDEIAQKKHDIILGIIQEHSGDDPEERTLYDHFKSLTLKRNLQSQVIQPQNVNNQYIINNVVLGILAKTGNVPYVLADAITYADLIVGLDVSRRKKRKLPGTTSAAGMARIYFANGELMRYNIREAMLEGEIIPSHVLQDIFPPSEFADKKIIVHRDGNLPEPEKDTLINWGKEIGATFYFVEVIKSGCPRLYAMTGQKQVIKPPKGSIFKLSETEALLVSSDLPDNFKATPNPIRICTHSPFPLTEALHSVLSLTLLHYGSVRPPRLPVTTYYADKISSMASRGLRPKDLDGKVPYWL